MITKNEINKLPKIHYKIFGKKDLDHCIEHLTNEVKHCSIHFAANNLPEEKLITLQQNLKSQKSLISLALTGNLSCQNSSNIIAELFGSSLESLKPSLKSLTFRGLYGQNTCSYLAQLIFENSNLTSLSVGSFWLHQNYSGLNKDTALEIAHALRTNKTLAILDFSANKNLMEGALAIADSLRLNQNLHEINFKNCSLSDDLELEFLEIFKHLTKIYLDQTIIKPSYYSAAIVSSEALEKTLIFLENTKNLSSITLTFYISDPLLNDNLQRLNLVIEQNKSLKTLELYNEFDTSIDFVLELTDSLKNHPNLEELVVRNSMGLNDDTIPSLVDVINSNRALRYISVGVLKVTQVKYACSKTACFSLFNALRSNRNLISVNFCRNFFPASDETANAIAKMLKTNKTLKSLNLSNCFSTINNKAVQIILSALAENQTLTKLNLYGNYSYLTMPVISQLKKNFSLTCLDLSDFSHNYRDYSWGSRLSNGSNNKVPETLSLGIEQILERNINRKISFLYQNLLLLTSFGLPQELKNYIFILMLLTFEYGLVSKISEKSLFENKDYINPPVVEEMVEQEADPKIDYFKTIYKALYVGQSSCFKNWNYLVDKVDLSEIDINHYIQNHPNSRTAKAWELADDYVNQRNFRQLFKTVHQYSYANSSNFFGLFKRSSTFSNGYHDNSYHNSKPGSRTEAISEVLDLGAIRL